MGRPKKINVNELSQTAGALPIQNKEVAKVVEPKVETKLKDIQSNVSTGSLENTNVSSILSKMIKDPYQGYRNLSEYTSAIRLMTISELHRHSIEVAKVVPTGDRTRLLTKLEYEYATAQNKKFVKFPVASTITAEQTENIKAIMARR